MVASLIERLPTTRWRQRLARARWSFTRAHYVTRQHGMALPCAAFSQMWFAWMHAEYKIPSINDWRGIYIRFQELLRRDLENVENGYYPRSLLFDMPWARYLTRAPGGILEMRQIRRRRNDNNTDDLPASLGVEYPSYYKRNFHWQSDGWLSTNSARRYDAGVELIFAATADVMRRMCIPPVVDALAAEGGRGRVLDVGMGTGRYLRLLHTAVPEAKLFGLDMSSYYVQFARQQLRHIRDVNFITENAETMPLSDDYFDASVAVFLLHELPKDARIRVLNEMKRTLKPGGTLVICESVQLSDSDEAMRTFVREFPVMLHEPYYEGYIRDPLEDTLRDLGFTHVRTTPAMWSKVVVATA